MIQKDFLFFRCVQKVLLAFHTCLLWEITVYISPGIYYNISDKRGIAPKRTEGFL